MHFCFIFRLEFFIAREYIFNFSKYTIIIVFIFLAQTHNIIFCNGFQCRLTNIKEFDESFSSPDSLFFLSIIHKCISSSNIVAVKRLSSVNLIFFKASRIQAKIIDDKMRMPWMLIFNNFKCFFILLGNSIELIGIGINFFALASGSKLFFLFCSLYWISLLLLFLFFRISLHYKRISIGCEKYMNLKIFNLKKYDQ